MEESGTPGFVGVGVLIHGSPTVGTTADGPVEGPASQAIPRSEAASQCGIRIRNGPGGCHSTGSFSQLVFYAGDRVARARRHAFDGLDNVGSETECLRNFRPGGSSQLAKECCNTAMCRRLTSLAGDGGRRDNETPRLKPGRWADSRMKTTVRSQDLCPVWIPTERGRSLRAHQRCSRCGRQSSEDTCVAGRRLRRKGTASPRRGVPSGP